MTTLPHLTDGDLVLRPLEDADLDAVVALLNEPAVARWWGENDHASVLEERELSLTIEHRGEVVGLLLVHEETEPMYRSVALDIALATAVHGQGLGSRSLRAVVRHYIVQGHHRFEIDPAADNAAAIACYRKLGFRDVGILRRSERAPDGTWRDGLQMDLLAEELT